MKIIVNQNTFQKMISILKEGKQEIEGGGKITFSIEGKVGDNKLKSVFNLAKNEMSYKSVLKDIISKLEIPGCTISKPQMGLFKSDSGKVVSDVSITVEVLGIESEKLLSFADEILKKFPAESVLIQDYALNKKFFYSID